MKYFIFFSVGIAALIFMSCAGTTIPVHTADDVQQLEAAKALFKNQFEFEDDIHPIIQAYLDEVLHDPDSFRLERFEYTIANYPAMVLSKKRTILRRKSTKVLYKQVLIPAYHINMRFRSRVPESGTQTQEMRFYLLTDKQLILPNNLAVPLIE